MAGFNGYVVKLSFGWTNDEGVPPWSSTIPVEDEEYHNNIVCYIPKIPLTKAEFQSEYTRAIQRSALADKITALQMLGVVDFGVPFFNPGPYYPEYTDIMTLRDVPELLRIAPNCTEFLSNMRSGYIWTALVTSPNGYGFYTKITTGKRRRVFKDASDTTRTYTAESKELGFNGYPDGFVELMFVTADNKVCFLPVRDYYTSDDVEWMSDALSTRIVAWLDGLPNLIDEDPYVDPEGTGTSTGGGGFGQQDNTSDPVDFPALPSFSAADAGLISVFNPSITELKNLVSYMWTDSLFDLDNFRKIVADPMDIFLSLMIVPFTVPNGAPVPFMVGNISTGISMTLAAQQYVEVSCGSLTIEKDQFWASYLDYDPYTKVELFLPFIGFVSISADEIVGKTTTIKYYVDLMTGAGVAFVKCGASVLYEYPCNCATCLPFTGNSYTQMIKAIVDIAATATAGAFGYMAADTLGSLTKSDAARSVATDRMNERTASDAGSIVDKASQLKPTFKRSGTLGSSCGLLGGKKPYFVFTRPNLCLPARQNKYIGYPSFITVQLKDLIGYTYVEGIHLEGIPCTDVELTMIETLLKGGVIF